jgi:hypothetical protein
MVKTRYKLQQRDAKGRFLSFDGTRPGRKQYTKAEIEELVKNNGQYTAKQIQEAVKNAFLAGLNDQGGMYAPSRKLSIYLVKNGFKI